MKEVLSNSPVTREWAREWAGELIDNAWTEGRTEAIFNYLKIKFGLEAGEWQEKVRLLADKGTLDRILERLFTAESKEEAQAIIQETLTETTRFPSMQ
jgi:hypothetical protein